LIPFGFVGSKGWVLHVIEGRRKTYEGIMWLAHQGQCKFIVGCYWFKGRLLVYGRLLLVKGRSLLQMGGLQVEMGRSRLELCSCWLGWAGVECKHANG
jgi:hypothetical protein